MTERYAILVEEGPLAQWCWKLEGKEAKDGSPWGPPSKGVRYDGWKLDTWGTWERCEDRRRQLKRAGKKFRFEKWRYGK